MQFKTSKPHLKCVLVVTDNESNTLEFQAFAKQRDSSSDSDHHIQARHGWLKNVFRSTAGQPKRSFSKPV